MVDQEIFSRNTQNLKSSPVHNDVTIVLNEMLIEKLQVTRIDAEVNNNLNQQLINLST